MQLEDLANEDPLAGWLWTSAVYENGTISCTVPQMDESLNQDGSTILSYNVDVALNG
jgi:hypothetical protein